MRAVIVIPARMASTRCPGKPLRVLAGKPMIQWVFEAAAASGAGDKVVVAAPDQEIVDAARAFGADSILTRHDHPTGTDRIAEVAQQLEADYYINVQGDEPLIKPEAIATCAVPLKGGAQMASVYDWGEADDADNPNIVKVVTDSKGRALYFSRSPIPHFRSQTDVRLKKHVGLYAYSRDVLLSFSKWEPTPLERTEVLEQLRFMENGVEIYMSYAPGTPVAVDTPEQADMAAELLAGGSR